MGTDLYYFVHSEGIRGHGLQLRQGRFRLDVRKKKIHCYSDQVLE